MTQIKNKKRQAISGKNDYSIRHFTSSFNCHSWRKIPKIKGKNPGQDVSVNLSENITHNNRNNNI